MPQRAANMTTELVLEIFRLNGELIAMGDALVGELGLTSARWQVMGAIALANTPLPIAQIARNMGLTRQAVQRVANELEGEGFIRFAPNPNHQRARLVLLTRKGLAAYAAAMGRWEPKAQALGGGSTLKDIETALVTLRRVRQRIAKDQGQGELS
jgi:DNA-binding MarR family transcriptional regulator